MRSSEEKKNEVMCFLCKADGSLRTDLFLPKGDKNRPKSPSKSEDGGGTYEDSVKSSCSALMSVFHIMVVPAGLLMLVFIRRRWK
jgi:hypothetical protein